MKYTDKQRIEKIKETVSKLQKYISDSGISRKDVADNETIRWTLTTPLYNIGEHAYNLSAEFKNEHNEIPWSKISGLRHRLVHDYDDTNWDIVCDVIFNIIPEFERQLNDLD